METPNAFIIDLESKQYQLENNVQALQVELALRRAIRKSVKTVTPWECPFCTFINVSYPSICEVCDENRCQSENIFRINKAS